MKARFHPFSDLLLERYLAGELDAAEAGRIEDAAGTRPELAAHLAERRAEREAFKLRRSPLKLPAESPPRLELRWAFATLAFAAAAVLLAVVVPRPDTNEPGIAMRGEGRVQVAVAVQRGAEVFAHRDGVVLLPKDRIRLTVRAPEAGYVTVLGRDARREPQVLYEAVRVSGETTLDGSLELDETPGTEELVVFFTAAPLSRAQALERAGRGALDEATVVKLSKGAP